MGDADAAYVMIRNDYLRDEISAERARELFAAAQIREGAELTGDLSCGFGFWARTMEDGVRLVRCRVERVEQGTERGCLSLAAATVPGR